jgi:hypothetical protein
MQTVGTVGGGRGAAVRAARQAGLLLLLLAVVAPEASARTVNLTATGVRIGDHPGFVRVVVDFTDGRVPANEATVVDDGPADGLLSMRVTHPGVRSEAAPVTRHGVRVVTTAGGGRLTARLSTTPRRFKHVSYTVLRAPERLVVDLWKAVPVWPAAARRDDGCLRLTSVTRVGARVRLEGRVLRRLFEGSYVVALRDARGRLVAQRPRIIQGTGRWSATLVPRGALRGRGTAEVFVGGAKDAGLLCLVQLPVVL